MNFNSGLLTLNYYYILFGFLTLINAQNTLPHGDFTNLTKRVYYFTKVEFITEEGEFNEKICTFNIPELKDNSPPFVAIYYNHKFYLLFC